MEEFKKGEFDLILMDIQMPVMDGLRAAAAIRQLEKDSGGRRTPIVALTAYAATGDREMCRQAGCDDYLVKPVRKRALLEAVAARVPGKVRLKAEADELHGEDESLQAAGREVVVFPEFRDLVPEFLADVRADLARIRDLAAHGDLDAVRRLCHDIKGAGGGYGLEEISRLAYGLELAAKGGDGAGTADPGGSAGAVSRHGFGSPIIKGQRAKIICVY